MTLTNEATAGLRKQIKEHKDCIKDLQAEIALIEKDFGETEHPLKAIIKKYRRVAKLNPPTDEECQTLYDLHGEKKVIETMENMENWKGITKNVSFNLTIINWLKRDILKAQPTGRVIKDGFTPIMDKDELEKNRDGWKNIKLI